MVDQLEELFTTSPEADQRAFLEGLVQAIEAPDSRLRAVCTLRADFFDRPLGVQRFGAAVSDATVTIPVMAPAELEAAIVEPARRAGRAVEGALVAELVDAVAHEPAALPSLQFTLFELAEAGPGHLALAAYRELGGVTGAITVPGRAALPILGRRRTGGGAARLRAAGGDQPRRRADPATRRAVRSWSVIWMRRRSAS